MQGGREGEREKKKGREEGKERKEGKKEGIEGRRIIPTTQEAEAGGSEYFKANLAT